MMVSTHCCDEVTKRKLRRHIMDIITPAVACQISLVVAVPASTGPWVSLANSWNFYQL
jgi:hypothetical protein